jgi:hypothetical protein
MNSKRRSAALLPFLTAATVLCCACANPDVNGPSAAIAGRFFAVTADSTPFYHYGPQQSSGPDKKLSKDTLMTLIHSSFGYSNVKLITGEQGYVANEDIRAAPAALVSAATATPTPARRNYPEPEFPSAESTPEVEPTPIPNPSPPGN